MTVLGEDISYWQLNYGSLNHVDFAKAIAQGVEFVFIRNSFGTSLDTRFKQNWMDAKTAKLLRGAYHFTLLNTSGFAQVVDTLKDDPGELPVVLDLENYNGSLSLFQSVFKLKMGNTLTDVKQYNKELLRSFGVYKGLTLPKLQVYQEVWAKTQPSKVIAHIQDFKNYIKNKLNKNIILYTNPSTITTYLTPLPPWLAEIDLWIANYATKPYVPGWKNWTFWQKSCTGIGKDFGVESQSIDLDEFNGTREQLYAYANQTVPAPNPTNLTVEQRLSNVEKEITGIKERLTNLEN